MSASSGKPNALTTLPDLNRPVQGRRSQRRPGRPLFAMTSSRQALRQVLRQNRRTLSGSERAWREAALLQALLRHPLFFRARNIALYWPADGEVDLRPLMLLAQPRQRLYLPVITQGMRLSFAPWEPSRRLRLNRYRIPEPCHQPRERRKAHTLDLVLMPLVGFDHAGHRLGMGGGFYDRTFAFRLSRRHWRKPWLFGVAFALQHCPALSHEPWDVPLDGIATEDGIRLFNLV